MESDDIVPYFFTKEETRVRALVLSFSLKIEVIVSNFLRQILDIKEPSKSLGNNSSSLSLRQKVNLLLDTKYFEKENVSAILTFMEIRNQFMHNDKAKSFTDCMRFIEGKKAFLIRTYPNDKTTEEDILEQCWTDLTADVINSLEKVIEVIKDRGPKKLGDKITVYFNRDSDEQNH